MLSSYELIGFISPELAHRILADTAEDNRDLYEATLSAVARLRGMRPQFLKRQPKPTRHKTMVQAMSKPAFDEAAGSLLRGWLLKHQIGLLTQFLDALGIEHEEGVVEDLPKTIADDALAAALETLLANHERDVVVLYLHAFHNMNEAGWQNLEAALESDERLQLF
ncbi:MAG: hypothetical protein H8E27_09645 [Verrucomicrobia subdivision 3 bacterium]|nr:hypothetical protein [Limisphaerales bacterium]